MPYGIRCLLVMRRLTTIAVSLATFIACLVFITTLARATLYYENTAEVDIPINEHATAVPRMTPMRLVIPRINVDAKVQDVGRGKSDNMAVPSNYTDVGWYRYGPTPGEVGSAVIDGHVDNGFGMDAVFKHIKELEPGDDIFITNGAERTHFVIEEVTTYAANEVPRDLLFTRTDAARLNLITCSGTWDGETKSYDERVVVYATLAPDAD
jgi:LPXTG-site transpeptidase (sortase) family protein